MDSILEVSISYDPATKEWAITNSPSNEITIQLTDRILFRSKDGKKYTIIIDDAIEYFDAKTENYHFIFPPILAITDVAETEIASPGLAMQLYVQVGDNLIKHDAPPKIIIGS